MAIWNANLGDVFGRVPEPILVTILRHTMSLSTVLKCGMLSKGWRQFVQSHMSEIVPVLDFRRICDVTDDLIFRKVIRPIFGELELRPKRSKKKQKKAVQDIGEETEHRNYAPQELNLCGCSEISMQILK